MKKKFLTFSLFCLMVSFGYAQTLSVQKSTTKTLKDKRSLRTWHLELIGEQDDNLYYLHVPQRVVDHRKKGGNTYQISKYDKRLRLLNKEPVDVRYQNARMELESVILLDNKLHTITSFHNTKTQKHLLFARELSNSTLKPVGNLKMIGELSHKDLPKYSRTRIRVELSEDNSKMMVFYTFVTAENSVIKNALYVYDDKLELIWKNENMKQGVLVEGVFTYERFKISNEGEVYLLGKAFISKEDYEDQARILRSKSARFETIDMHKPVYVYTMHIYSADNRNGESVEFALPNQFIKDMNFNSIGNGNIICFGIYSDPGFISPKGGFIFQYNLNTARMSNLKTTTIDSQLQKGTFTSDEIEYLTESSDNEKEWSPYSYSLSELMFRANGDYFFIAEQTLTGTMREVISGTIVIMPVYYYDDLFVFNATTDLTTLSYNRISKHNYCRITNRNGSYAVTEHNGELYFLYNELPRQLKYTITTRLGSTHIARLNSNGTVDKVMLEDRLPLLSLVMMPNTATGNIGVGGFIYASLRGDNLGYRFEIALIK